MYRHVWRVLAIAVQLQGVASLPGCVAGASDGQVKLVALAQSTALLSRGRQPTHLPVLVHGLCDPLGVGVASDGLVEGIDQNHLKELVGGVLTHPVRAEHSQGPAVTTSTLLEEKKEHNSNQRPIRLTTQNSSPSTPDSSSVQFNQ